MDDLQRHLPRLDYAQLEVILANNQTISRQLENQPTNQAGAFSAHFSSW